MIMHNDRERYCLSLPVRVIFKAAGEKLITVLVTSHQSEHRAVTAAAAQFCTVNSGAAAGRYSVTSHPPPPITIISAVLSRKYQPSKLKQMYFYRQLCSVAAKLQGSPSGFIRLSPRRRRRFKSIFIICRPQFTDT